LPEAEVDSRASVVGGYRRQRWLRRRRRSSAARGKRGFDGEIGSCDGEDTNGKDCIKMRSGRKKMNCCRRGRRWIGEGLDEIWRGTRAI